MEIYENFTPVEHDCERTPLLANAVPQAADTMSRQTVDSSLLLKLHNSALNVSFATVCSASVGLALMTYAFSTMDRNGTTIFDMDVEYAFYYCAIMMSLYTVYFLATNITLILTACYFINSKQASNSMLIWCMIYDMTYIMRLCLLVLLLSYMINDRSISVTKLPQFAYCIIFEALICGIVNLSISRLRTTVNISIFLENRAGR